MSTPVFAPQPSTPRQATSGGKNWLALVSLLFGLLLPLLVVGPVAVLMHFSVSLGLFSILVPFLPPLVTVVLGHIALARARYYAPGQAWRGLAIAGLVLGYLEIAAAAAFWILGFLALSRYG